MRSTYKSMLEEDSWVCVKFKIPIRLYLAKFKGRLNGLHRSLSNSHAKLGGVSNRMFWKKTIQSGLFRSYSTPTHVHMIYFLKTKDQRPFSFQIMIRIRKIINCKVEVLPIDNIDEVEKVMLNCPYGITNYKKIKP